MKIAFYGNLLLCVDFSVPWKTLSLLDCRRKEKIREKKLLSHRHCFILFPNLWVLNEFMAGSNIWVNGKSIKFISLQIAIKLITFKEHISCEYIQNKECCMHRIKLETNDNKRTFLMRNIKKSRTYFRNNINFIN